MLSANQGDPAQNHSSLKRERSEWLLHFFACASGLNNSGYRCEDLVFYLEGVSPMPSTLAQTAPILAVGRKPSGESRAFSALDRAACAATATKVDGSGR